MTQTTLSCSGPQWCSLLSVLYLCLEVMWLLLHVTSILFTKHIQGLQRFWVQNGYFFFFLQSKPKWTYLMFCLLSSTALYSKLGGSEGVIAFFNLHIEWPYWIDSTSVWLWEYPRGKNRALHTDSISAVVWLIRNPAMSTTDTISTIPFSPAFPI